MIFKILNGLYSLCYNIYKKLIYYIFVIYENNYPIKPLKVCRQDASYKNNNYNNNDYNDYYNNELAYILNNNNRKLTRSNSDSNLYNKNKNL
tara:strand:- start:3501 stop:3776 length:276 start_codon:yes stop_codon:yes gene_type:complete